MTTRTPGITPSKLAHDCNVAARAATDWITPEAVVALMRAAGSDKPVTDEDMKQMRETLAGLRTDASMNELVRVHMKTVAQQVGGQARSEEDKGDKKALREVQQLTRRSALTLKRNAPPVADTPASPSPASSDARENMFAAIRNAAQPAKEKLVGRICANPSHPAGTTLVATHRCSKCKITWYCGAACQKADWKKHKVTCPPA
jgi:hypothetical protein